MRGSIVKKPNGRLYIVYRVGKKQKWEKVPENKHGRQTKTEAERLLNKRIHEINSSTYREIKKTTFREFAERWLRDYVDDPNHVKPSTARGYHQIFNNHLVPHFGDYWLGNITADEIQKLIGMLGRKNLSPQTIRNILTPMTTMFKHSVKWGYLKSSPMLDVDRPKVIKKEMAFLSPDKIRRFLVQVPEKWNTFFVTAVMTGMRLGELVAMKWSNLDWEESRYNVRERFYKGEFDTPKTQASLRAIDLSPTVLASLRDHRIAQNQVRLSRGPLYQDRDFIFAKSNGMHYEKADNIRRVLADALTEAGCQTVRFHDLRHSCAALLIYLNESPKLIQRQLGHSSIKMTFDIYGHLMDDVGTEAMIRADAQVFVPNLNCSSHDLI